MKVVYIAHPIGGDVEQNLNNIAGIVRIINLNLPVVPFVPYYADCIAMNDSNPEERKRSIRNNRELFNRRAIDELWLYGDKISLGMEEEVRMAYHLTMPIIAKSPELKEPLKKLLDSIFQEKKECPSCGINDPSKFVGDSLFCLNCTQNLTKT